MKFYFFRVHILRFIPAPSFEHFELNLIGQMVENHFIDNKNKKSEAD